MLPADPYTKKYKISCCSLVFLLYVAFCALAIILPYLIAYWTMGK